MYVDDCGKPEKIHRNNKYFGLSAVIIKDRDWNKIDFEISKLKQDLEIDEINTRNIYQMEKEYQPLNQNPERSREILEKIFDKIAELDVVLISSVIDKDKFN